MEAIGWNRWKRESAVKRCNSAWLTVSKMRVTKPTPYTTDMVRKAIKPLTSSSPCTTAMTVDPVNPDPSSLIVQELKGIVSSLYGSDMSLITLFDRSESTA